jgi:hypothetical protein
MIRNYNFFFDIQARAMLLRFPMHSEEDAFGPALLATVGCNEFDSLEDAARLVRYH